MTARTARLLPFSFWLCASALGLAAAPCHAQGEAPPNPRALLQRALQEMGGEKKLRALREVELEGIGHTYYIEQSERPEGPWIVRYEQISETRDYARASLRRQASTRIFTGPGWQPSPAETVADGVAVLTLDGKSVAGSPNQVAEAQESLELSPERALLTALDATDLRAEPDRTMQGATQHGVGFTWRDGRARIWLDARTGTPTAIDVERAYPASVFLNAWGDVSTRTYLSMWTLEPGGIRYPRQWNVERNGTPYREFSIASLRFSENAGAGPPPIPDDVRNAYAAAARTVDDWPLGLEKSPPTEPHPGLVLVPGRWNIAYVRQADGIVVIEAPISSRYSEAAIAEAKRRFPGSPIKAVVSTSDAWPHLAGVRQYAAEGVPIMALDLNIPIVQRMLAAPHTYRPDAWARKNAAAPELVPVSTKTVVGSGPNRIELYPVRSENGERMLMAYFPEYKLLYGSDLVQRQPDGKYFMPGYLYELLAAADRERLAVDKVFAFHAGIVPIAELRAAVAEVRTAKP